MKHAKTRQPKRPITAPVERPEPSARPAPAPARDRRTWLLAVPMVLLVAAAFGPALDNGFVVWDDDINFIRNPNYRGLGWPRIAWAWTTFRAGVYQPVGWLICEAQYALFGMDPRGYHLGSLLLHAAAAVALFALASDLLVRCRPDAFLGRPWARALGAGLAAALFAVHPARVESVAWVSCQSYLPCALFAMLAILAYLRAVGSGPARRWGWWAASLLLFAAALLSKAPAVSLPFVLLILDVYPLRRLGGGPGRWFGPEVRKVWLEKLPFFALSLVFMGLALAARASVQTLNTTEGIKSRLARAVCATWFYVAEALVPTGISPFYPMPPRLAWDSPRILGSLLAVAATTVVLVLLRRRWPGLLAAWLAYLVLLAPSSGLQQIGRVIAADRYSYLPTIGFAIVAAAGLGLPWAAGRRARGLALATAGAALAAIAVLVSLTRAQCPAWRDTESLWTHALEHGGPSGTAHSGLGTQLLQRGEIDEAEAHCLAAVRLDPENPQAHTNLGLVRLRRGDLTAAAAHFADGIRLDPGSAQPHVDLGLVLARRGDVKAAADHYAEALRIDPELTEAHVNLGSVLEQRGDFAGASAHYAEALRIDPDLGEAYNNFAMLLASCPDPRFRDGPRAVAYATRACERTKWTEPGCLDTLAAAHAEAGDFAAAVARQEQAIALLPDGPRKEDYRTRLALYRAGQPVRSPAPAGAGH